MKNPLLLFLVLSAIFYIQQRWVGHLRTPDVEEDRHIWSGTVCSTTRRGNLLFGAFRGACLIAVSGVALYDWSHGTTWRLGQVQTSPRRSLCIQRWRRARYVRKNPI